MFVRAFACVRVRVCVCVCGGGASATRLKSVRSFPGTFSQRNHIVITQLEPAGGAGAGRVPWPILVVGEHLLE